MGHFEFSAHEKAEGSEIGQKCQFDNAYCTYHPSLFVQLDMFNGQHPNKAQNSK